MPSREPVPRKVVVLGVDGAIGPRWYRFAREGHLPVSRRLMANGTTAINCLPPFPTITPPNWTCIATGAWAGTHGITDFYLPSPTGELHEIVQAFDGRECCAEYLWNSAARAGKRTLLVNWPATWPSVVDNGVQLGGAGIGLTEYRIGVPAPWNQVAMAGDSLFSTQGEPLSVAIDPSALGGVLQLRFAFRKCLEPIEEPISLFARIHEIGGAPRVAVYRDPSAPPITEMSVGEWSDRLTLAVAVGEELVDTWFRCKLLDCDPARGLFRLYVTDLCGIRGWDHPTGVLGDCSSYEGIPTSASSAMWSYSYGWIDLETFVELQEMTTRWQTDASVALMQREPWDLFFTHIHAPDLFYHLGSSKLDPVLTPDGRERGRFEAAELELYQATDRAIGQILEAAGDDTLVVVVSDHGATPKTRLIPVREILEEAGLLRLQPDTGGGDGRALAQRTRTDLVYDWAATRAVPQRSCFVYVNLEGRDPEGSVAPRDYEMVRDEIITALLSYRDPETGICPFSLVLRREDARILGLYGDRIGDVVFAVREEFSDEHGQILATGEWKSGAGSMRSVLILSGPGIKRGHVLERSVWLTDIAPTIAHVAELPVPRDADGAVLYQALEEPDGPVERQRALKERYDLLETAFQRAEALTHTYM